MKNIIYHNVVNVTEKGIILGRQNKNIYIKFDDCAKNFSLEKGKERSKCVASRDITTLSFIFYTQPRIKVVFKKNFLAKKSAASKFFDLQEAIIKAGYTSYDLS